jgi:hypothetical protein
MFAAQTLHVRIVKRVFWIKSELLIDWSPSALTPALTPLHWLILMIMLLLLLLLLLLLRLIKRFNDNEPAPVVERQHSKLAAAHGVMQMLRHALGLVISVHVEVSAPPHIKCSNLCSIEFHGLDEFAKRSCCTVSVRNLN